MTVSIENLRDRLDTRQASLAKLRSRIKSAKDARLASKKSPVKSSISDIQKRYLSAVAELDLKKDQVPKPVIHSSNQAVSSLASRWNKGIEKKVEKTVVRGRGDVLGAKKHFSGDDVPNQSKVPRSGSKKTTDPGPAELLVEDDSDVPSWAKNQKKVVLKKENARSSVRNVDLTEIRGSVMNASSKDSSESDAKEVVVGGNVKAALAMWGKTAEEDAKVLAMKKEEEKKKKAEEERKRKEREEQERKKKLADATAKFAKMSLDELGNDEPEDEVILIAYLERKIALIEKQIKDAEAELDDLENDGQ